MDKSIIDDIRTTFNNITFSEYQKSKAKSELIKCIYNNKLENAIYWSAEFICAGHFLDLWEIIILYYTKYIHIGNVKLSLYLDMRYMNFKSIITNGYENNILVLRNNQKIRKLFCEIICILCYSPKRLTIEPVKLNKNEFDLTNLSLKFKAPNINYVQNVFREEDPKEFFIPINELMYNFEEKNIIEILYWFEWILEYEAIIKKKNKKCFIENRMYAPKGFEKDIIWIIWDVIYYYIENYKLINRNCNIDNLEKIKNIKRKICNSLFNLYTIRFSPVCKKKRKLIIYFVFTVICEDINIDIAIYNNKEIVQNIVDKVDLIYKDVKKNEHSPKTDYLFKNVKQKNFEKSIEKLEMLNNFNNNTIENDEDI